jgi:hypothetical protein
VSELSPSSEDEPQASVSGETPSVTPEPIASPENIPPPSPAPENAPTPPLVPVSFSPPPPQSPPDTPKPAGRRRRRGSLFFPILLIVAGAVLLLDNLGIITGSAWGTLISLWPVLFIAWGLDSIWRGEGLTGAVFLLGLGVVFLLGNFGYLQLNPWYVLFTIWPILLVAIGIDILVGRRRKWWTTLLGFILVLAIMAGALYLAGVGLPGGQVVTGDQVEFGLQGATRAEVQILPSAGTLYLDILENSDALLKGIVPASTANQKILQEFTKSGDVARLMLQSTGAGFFYPTGQQSQSTWKLELTPNVPVNLELSFGVGDSVIDLSGLQIPDFIHKMGVGIATITLPDKGIVNAKIEAGVGTITIYVPAGMAVQLKADTALVARSLPADYVKQGQNSFVSPNYDTAENKIILEVGLAVGTVTIKQK